MNVNLKAEAFFCPTRLLMMGYEKWLRGDVDMSYGSAANVSGNATSAKLHPPVISFDPSNSSYTPYFAPGSLADYLGMRSDITAGPFVMSAFPFLAYHLIWNDWYRQSLVQKSCFHESYVTTGSYVPAAMKYKYPLESSTGAYTVYPISTLADGVKLGALRQRNFGSDYFTSATPSAQYGSAQKISMFMPYDENNNIVYDALGAENAEIDESGNFTTEEGYAQGPRFMNIRISL